MELYDNNLMPVNLVKAHQQLDKAVEQCYRVQPFTSDAMRIEFLFELYENYTAGLFVREKKVKNHKNSVPASGQHIPGIHTSKL